MSKGSNEPLRLYLTKAQTVFLQEIMQGKHIQPGTDISEEDLKVMQTIIDEFGNRELLREQQSGIT